MTDRTIDDARIQALLDKQEIQEVIHRRARAADRKDLTLARSCFHDGGTEDHGGFVGDVDEYLKWSPISDRSGDPHRVMWHFVSNILIDLDGDTARVESMVLATETIERDGAKHDTSVGGRYLDRFERRDGRWAIVERRLVFDWSRVEPPTVRYWDFLGIDPATLPMGRFDGEDPLWQLLPEQRPAD